MSAKPITLFLVDDDAVFLKSLQVAFLATPNYTVKTFATGELCMEQIGSNPDVVILDYHLDGITPGVMNGLQTLDKIKLFNPEIPVIVLSSQDKIDVAINCMHHDAFDYVVKSETAFVRLQKNIALLFRTTQMEKELKWYMDRA